MPFDHEKLDVYAVAMDFLVLANGRNASVR